MDKLTSHYQSSMFFDELIDEKGVARAPAKQLLNYLDSLSEDELEKRPLFKDPIAAEKMYQERDAIYESKADIIIDASVDLESVLSTLYDIGL